MKKALLYTFIILTIISSTRISYAAVDEYTLLEPLPCIEGTGNDCSGKTTIPKINFETYIGYVFKLAIALAVFLATVVIIYGGFEYMLSEIPYVKVNAKGRITSAILGLAAALASYLILLTIDPRLVQITTKIEPIKIAIDPATENFQSKLTEDLTKLTQEKQLEVRALGDKITDLQKQRVALKAQLDRGEITEYDYAVGTTNIDTALRDTKANQDKVLATENGLIGFNNAYRAIANPNQTDEDRNNIAQYSAQPIPNTLKDGKYPENSPNIIQNHYNIRINKILETTGDLEVATTLANQRDFYIAQVREEIALSEDIKFVKRLKTQMVVVSVGVPGIGSAASNRLWEIKKEALIKELARHQENLTNQQKLAESGLPKDQYDKIMQTRVDAVNKMLTPQ